MVSESWGGNVHKVGPFGMIWAMIKASKTRCQCNVFAREKCIICETYCSDFCLSFNTKKTKSMIFGKSLTADPYPLCLGGEDIDYVSDWKYLGCLISSGKKFTFSAKNDLRSFYCSANSILSVLRKPNEQILMKLLYSNCIPIFTYASEVKCFSASEMTKCNVAVNDSIRRIFSFHRWESIRKLREAFGYPDLYSIFAKRRAGFLRNLPTLNNVTLKCLADFVTSRHYCT